MCRPATTGFSRRLKARVTIPELTKDDRSRESLVPGLDSALERRLTVLRAPAGFGKTAALADLGRRMQKAGVVVGWLLCDEQDAPSALVHAACAFEHARLDLSPLGELDVWSALPAAQQMGTLVRAMELHAAPCLLVLDEVDRLAPRSADLVDRLLQRGPGNFHVAAACRSNPRIDLTAHDLHGSVRVIGAEQLGASAVEVGRGAGGPRSAG